MINNRFILGLLLASFASLANANGDSCSSPSGCIPCVSTYTPAPVVICSNCPANGEEKSGCKSVEQISSTAIKAAQESMSKSKEFYERFTWILSSLIAIFAFIASIGGLAFLKSQVADVTKKEAAEVFKENASDINKIREKLEDHLKSRKEFRDDMEDFKKIITNNLTAFLIFIPKYVELSFWVSELGGTPQDQRLNLLHRISTSALESCEKALACDPQDNLLLALIYSNQGVAYHILGKYEAAYNAMTESLKYDTDRPPTLHYTI